MRSTDGGDVAVQLLLARVIQHLARAESIAHGITEGDWLAREKEAFLALSAHTPAFAILNDSGRAGFKDFTEKVFKESNLLSTKEALEGRSG